MDNFFPENSVINISRGLIENISSQNDTVLVTISYTDYENGRRNDRTVRLAVGNNTLILDESGNAIPVSELRAGMIINAVISSAMTRSIPPQASAFLIRIVRRPAPENVTIGRIVDIDRHNRSFTTISGNQPASMIRFAVPPDALIIDRFGIRMNFSRLVPGMQVWIRHASFMIASIPPQTTAYEIRVV